MMTSSTGRSAWHCWAAIDTTSSSNRNILPHWSTPRAGWTSGILRRIFFSHSDDPTVGPDRGKAAEKFTFLLQRNLNYEKLEGCKAQINSVTGWGGRAGCWGRERHQWLDAVVCRRPCRPTTLPASDATQGFNHHQQVWWVVRMCAFVRVCVCACLTSLCTFSFQQSAGVTATESCTIVYVENVLCL